MADHDLIFRFEQADTAGPNSLEAYWHEGQLTIEIDNPWAGDSETGFGATTSITMNAEEARWLIEWLKAWAKAGAKAA